MYVLMFDSEVGGSPTANTANAVPSLSEAFERICCHCGLSHRFMASEGGWLLELTDVEHPERSPDAIFSTYKRRQDAHHDLMTQAVDGRIRGHVAIRDDLFGHARLMQNIQGMQVEVA